MKVLVFGDVHWSTYSSILRSRDEKYSTRLKLLINSMNWVESFAKKENVDIVVGLGDFFDKESLTSEEITALKEINWSNIEHYFLIGNHEMGRNDLAFSSTQVFNRDKFYVIEGYLSISYFNENSTLVFFPYILNPTKEEFEKIYSDNQTVIIFSHNDIAGIQLGKYVSKSGFEIKDIEDNCSLFINGHLHNGEKITDKIINLGNLTGQNFSEDASIYSHNIMILDTENLEYELIENPYAINFYKLDATHITPNLHALKNNSVVTLKCYENDLEFWKEEIKKYDNIIENRIILEKENNADCLKIDELNSNDHISEFRKYVLEKIGSSDLILEELSEVCK